MVLAVSYGHINSYNSKKEQPRTYNTQGLSWVWACCLARPASCKGVCWRDVRVSPGDEPARQGAKAHT